MLCWFCRVRLRNFEGKSANVMPPCGKKIIGHISGWLSYTLDVNRWICNVFTPLIVTLIS
jgi:hypothetical protein